MDPPRDEQVPSAPINHEGVDYIELPENGFGALVAWAAGLHRVRRAVDRLSHRTRVTTVAGDATTRHHRPRSPLEQRELADDVDAYLHDAGIPPRPRAFRWFVELPDGFAPDDLWAAVNIDLAADAATHPAHVLTEVRATLSRLYPAPIH